MIKNISKKKIFILALAIILLLPILLINMDFFKPIISNFILDQIRSKLNAEIVFVKPNYQFKRLKLMLAADEITIKQKDEVLVNVKNFNLVYPLRNLLRTTQIINNISADKLFINAVRNEDSWNLESILKPGGKKVDFLFKSLKFHDVDLEIHSKDFYEKENIYLDIHKDNELDLYKVEFYNNKELFNTKQAQAHNQFYISGDYDLNNHQAVYKYVKNLKVIFYKLKPNLINLISRGFTDRKSRFLYFFNKYSNANTELNLTFSEIDNEEESYVIDMDLNNLSNQANFHLDSKLHLGQDVDIVNLDIDFLDAKLKANGNLKKAFSKEPILDLTIALNQFNPYSFRNKIPELKSVISDKVVTFISSVHKNSRFDLAAKVTGSFNHPELNLNIPIFVSSSNLNQKNFNLNIVFGEKDYQIKNLLLPFEFADLSLNGTVFKTGAYDIKLLTQDFPLRSLKAIATSFMSDKDSKAIEDIVIQGYLKSDLKIKKLVNKEIPEFYGSIILAEASLLEPKIPVLLQNINAEIVAQKDLFKVLHFKGALYENSVDLNGFYNIYSKQHKVNISSKRFDLSKIEGYQIKKYIESIKNFSNIKGFIEDLEISSDGDSNNFSSSGKLVEVGFDYLAEGKIINLNNLEADYSYADHAIKLKGLSMHINNTSSLKIDGLIDFEDKKSDFSAQAKNLPFALLSLLNLKEFPVHAKDGVVNFDLLYKAKKIKAKGDLKGLSFNVDSKKMPENFRALTCDFTIDDNLFLNGMTAYYGNSLIKANSFKINRFFTKDKYYDIDIDSELKISEFESFIPAGIAKLLKMKGYLPLHVKAKGDSQKFYLDIDGNFDKIEKLSFADWLEYDSKVKADFKSSFSFTPKLILSKNTVLNLKNINSSTTIAADFEIHDWKNKEKELKYSIDANTPLDANGNYLPVDLDLIEPHIKSIETLNLDPGTGTVQCRTDGDVGEQHTFCDIEFLDKAVAKNFGIGDLSSSRSSVNLISITHKPVYVKVSLNEGVWKILDFDRVKFDMEITETKMNIDRIRAKLGDGFIRSNISFDFNTLESKFKIKANNLSAHKAAESFFALGYEVPQGTVSGQFDGKTKGLLPDEMFFNLEGEASALVRDGKLSSLKTMQKLLSAVNTLKNFDFNNVFQTLITYKGGIFQDLVSYIKFDKGKITTDKLLLHSEEIEIHLEGFVDYAKDYLTIRGLGAVPERSNSFLQLLGVKQFNVGNLLSIINLRNPGSKDKDYFAFSMKGPVNNLEEATQSLRQNFTWLNSYGGSK